MKLSLSTKIIILVVASLSFIFAIFPFIRIITEKSKYQPVSDFEYTENVDHLADIRKPYIRMINLIIEFFLFSYIIVILFGFYKKNAGRNDKKNLTEAYHLLFNGGLGIVFVVCLYALNVFLARNDNFNPNLNYGDYGWLEKIPGGIVAIFLINIVILFFPLLKMKLTLNKN